MGIRLGNLSVEQIEKRLGIELSEDDRKLLKDTRQEPVNDVPIEHGKWHCFDLPFLFLTHDKETAEKFLAIFQKFDTSKFKECFQIGWEA